MNKQLKIQTPNTRVTIIGKAKRGWNYECSCGKLKSALKADLFKGVVQSCGCLIKELIQTGLNRSHGKSKTTEYKAWLGMKKRCYNVNDKRYIDYGGRGITVCGRWLHSFETFLNDVGLKPSPELSLDRIDNDRNYEPGNVRWTTTKVQSRNNSRNVNITYEGKTLCITDWAIFLGISVKTIRSRMRYNWPIEKILTTPVTNKD
jgi:hypothetical protein